SRGTSCLCPAMRNRRRCRLHGGLSTGPRTPEGLERSRRAGWKHGARSREVRLLLRQSRQRWRELLLTLRDAGCSPQPPRKRSLLVAEIVGDRPSVRGGLALDLLGKLHGLCPKREPLAEQIKIRRTRRPSVVRTCSSSVAR